MCFGIILPAIWSISPNTWWKCSFYVKWLILGIWNWNWIDSRSSHGNDKVMSDKRSQRAIRVCSGCEIGMQVEWHKKSLITFLLDGHKSKMSVKLFTVLSALNGPLLETMDTLCASNKQKKPTIILWANKKSTEPFGWGFIEIEKVAIKVASAFNVDLNLIEC